MLVSQNPIAFPKIDPANIQILVSKWHDKYVNSLVDRFKADISKSGDHNLTIHVLSGCLEMPLACLDLHEHIKNIDIYVCFGILMRGETAHFDMILQTITSAFAHIIVNHRLPIVNCIIPANKLDEVDKRSRDDEFNKGTEAAISAIETIRWRRSVVSRTKEAYTREGND